MNEVILKLLGLLDQLVEERGVPQSQDLVDKNVIKSKNSPFDNDKVKKSGGLDPESRKTLVEAFTLFNQMFFDYQKTITSDTKEKTLVSDIADKQKQAATPPPLPKEKGGLGLMSMIMGGLTLLAASVGGIIASLSGFFGDSASKLIEAVSKLGFMGALKIISGTFLKKFSLKILKRLPIIGGIIGLAFAFKAFKNGDIFLGIAELISGLLNFIPGVGPLLSIGADILIAWAQHKGVFDEGGALSPENGWNTIKGWMGSIGKVIMDNALYLPIIGGFKRFGMAYDAFKGGKTGEGLKQIALGLFTFVGGGPIIKGLEVLAGWLDSPKEPEGQFNKQGSWMDKLKNWIKSKLQDLPNPIKWALRWFGIIPDEENDTSKADASALKGSEDGSKGIMGFVGGVWDKIKGPMGDAANSLGGFAVDAFNKAKEYTSKAWDSVSEEAPKIWAAIKETSSKAWDKAKEAGTWFKDSIVSMADKTKEVVSGWIPKIIDTISGIAGSAMDVLKSIASKIGGWIAGLLSPDEEKRMEEVKKQTTSKESVLYNDNLTSILVTESNTHNKWLNLLYDSSREQVKLLGMMVNIGNSSLRELQRMSGNTSGGGNTTIISPPQSTPKTPMISIENNRQGYSSSPYALS